jgi:hypothetical protein
VVDRQGLQVDKFGADEPVPLSASPADEVGLSIIKTVQYTHSQRSVQLTCRANVVKLVSMKLSQHGRALDPIRALTHRLYRPHRLSLKLV